MLNTQGQFAEKDNESNETFFELRNYDPLLGRFNTIDPYGQYFSPYLAMGNSHPNMIDPDGGYSASNPFLGTGGFGSGGASGLQILGSVSGVLSAAMMGNAFAFQNAVGELMGSVSSYTTPVTANKELKKAESEYVSSFEIGIGAVSTTEFGLGITSDILRGKDILDLGIKFNFSKTANIFGESAGLVGKTFGKTVSFVGFPLAVGSDYLNYKSSYSWQKISGQRFGFRTFGNTVALGVSLGFGLVPGAIAGGSAWALEQSYDGFMLWYNSTTRFIKDIERGLLNGWVPGRY